MLAFVWDRLWPDFESNFTNYSTQYGHIDTNAKDRKMAFEILTEI